MPSDAGVPTDAGVLDAGSQVTSVPDPTQVAPALVADAAETFGRRNAFLFEGPLPIQQDVAPNTLADKRLAVLRGMVRDERGTPLAGARVHLPAHPEYGWTLTRPDGRFDIAVNGGAPRLVEVYATGFLRAHREIVPGWRRYETVPDIVLMPLDNHATTVNLTNAATPALVEGATVSDSRGTRQGRLYLPPQVQAGLELPDGGFQQVGGLTLRITEFTQGDAGVTSMPAPLPPSSAFTYAAEFSADEADAVGATSVVFDRPLYHYVENFLGFPVGTVVPTGAYDRSIAKWAPSDDGRVVQVISVGSAGAELDGDGDGLADSASALSALGVTAEEQKSLATLYAPGQSFWRVPVAHFTPWDCNWPYGFPADARTPTEGGASARNRGGNTRPPGKPCDKRSSIIECESQVLGEEFELSGTGGLGLHYRSNRHVPPDDTVDFILTGSSIPPSLKSLGVELEVAGVTVRRSYPVTPNQSDSFSWNGLDAYGRPVVGTQTATLRMSYGYDGVYRAAGASTRSFNSLPASTSVTGTGLGTGTVSLFMQDTFRVDVTASPAFWSSTGGWSLTPHHVYDPGARRLHMGDGTSRSTQPLAGTAKTVAGTGSSTGGAGGTNRATSTPLGSPTGLAIMPDGAFYVSTLGGLKYVDASGTISSVARVANPGDRCSDNLGGTISGDMAWDGSNNLYFLHDKYTSAATGGWGLVCRMDLTTRKVHFVAGTLSEASTCNTGSASTLVLGDSLHGIAVGPDGTVFFSDNSGDCVRRIQLDGTVERVLGGGTLTPANGLDPRSVRVTNPQGLDVAPDGTLYVAGWGDSRIYRVTPDARFSIIGGGGAVQAAARTPLHSVRTVRVSPEGAVYFAQDGNTAPDMAVKRLSPDGRITTMLGTGSGFVEYANPTAVAIPKPHAIAFLPDHTESAPDFLATSAGSSSSSGHRVIRVQPASAEYTAGELLVPDAASRQLFVFDSAGRHQATRHLVTGATLWSFGYDTSGRLTSLTDHGGNTTTLGRDAAGNLTHVRGPWGATHAVTLDAAGHLATITSPGGRVTRMTHDAAGLLTRFERPDGTANQFTYDARGLLVEDRRHDGTSILLSSAESSTGRSVSLTEPTGQVTRYEVQSLDGGTIRRTVTLPSGTTRVFDYASGGDYEAVLPDGTTVDVTWAPDPRFGMQLPYVSSLIATHPSGRTVSIGTTRVVTLSNPDDVLSWTSWTERVTAGGADAGLETLDRAQRRATLADGTGNTTILEWDAAGRTTAWRKDAVAPPVQLAWDGSGRLSEVSSNGNTVRYAWDAAGNLQSRTTALGRVTSYTHDADGRLTSVTGPAGNVTTLSWDPAGRLSSLAPGGNAHALGWRHDDVLASYTPPGGGGFTRSFDAAGRHVGTAFGTGRALVLSRDADGRLSARDYADPLSAALAHSLAVTYPSSNDENLPQSLTITPAASSGLAPTGLTFQYDGRKWTRVEATGPAPSLAVHAWNGRGRLASSTFTTGSTTRTRTWSYDAAGRALSDGTFSFTRGGGGQLASSVDGTSALQAYRYDSLGRLSGKSLTVGGGVRYEVDVTRNADGRVSGRTESLSGTTATHAFTHAPSGALVERSEGGVPAESFEYDLRGNRVRAGSDAASYDAQDRLLSRGTTTYHFDADGLMSARGTDTFRYDALGQLLEATIGGERATYQYDGLQRRVARTTPAGTTTYHYGDPRSPWLLTAYGLPGEPLVVLHYDDLGHLLKMEQGGISTWVATDTQGSVRALLDGSGNVLRERRYGAYGDVLLDTAPAGPELPLGYAGGLHDGFTGLVRFGFRDYEPNSGRFVSRDPAFFTPGALNLYAYVANDPVSAVDLLGLFAVEASAYEGIGGGFKLAFTEEGWSICAEVGLGAGVSVGATSGGLDETGWSTALEGSIGCGPIGLMGGFDFAPDPCGDWGNGSASFKTEGNVGPVKVEYKPETGSAEWKVAQNFDDVADVAKPRCSVQAKAAVKQCKKHSW